MTLRSNKKAAFAFSALAIGVASLTTQAHAASQILGVDISQPSFNVTQLRFNFEGTPVTPIAYQQAGSNQLVLDFNQVATTLPRNATINTGIIDDVVTLTNANTVRLMFNLKSAATYSTRIEGNQLVLDIVDIGTTSPIANGGAAPQVMNVTVNPLLSPANAQAKRGAYEGISSVDYKPNGEGGDITIALTNEVIPVDVQRQGNKIVVRTTGASIPRHLLRRINAGGLVANIDAANQGQNGVLTINMSSDYEYQAYQSGSQLSISVKPPKLLQEPTIEEKRYTGEPLSMEFQDVSVRTVLDVLAQFTGNNIVASDEVTGNITLRLINVPWDQALDIVLKSKNLGKRVNNNVILVKPADVLAAEEIKEREAADKLVVLAPLRKEFIRLNYAKAEAVFELFEKATSNGGGANAGSGNSVSTGLLSPRGSVIVDARTNTLIVNDTSESINDIRAMIEKIDIPVSQVMIEARIVNATDDFSKSMGVKWGLLHNGSDVRVAGSDTTIWNMRTARNGTATIERPANLNVDLGATNPAGKIAFGLLSISDTLLDLELSAMQADNRGEVISSPKVLTSDKQKAKILSGDKIPYATSALNGATTVTFIDAALILEATPNITPDGKIGLELTVTNGRVTTAVNGSLAVSEDSIQTNVVLEDGQTIVLGGVFRNTIGNQMNKVPFLGDLPYVGRLFRSETRENKKQELLIFITPKLVSDGTSRIN